MKKIIVFDLIKNKYLDSLDEKYDIYISTRIKDNRGNFIKQVDTSFEYVKSARENIISFFCNDTINISIMFSHYIYYPKKVEGHNIILSRIIRNSYYKIPPSNKDTILINSQFPEACIYDKNLFDRACPKCQQTDFVKHLVWGDEQDLPSEISRIYESECFTDHIIQRSSCNPNWICLRDSLRF